MDKDLEAQFPLVIDLGQEDQMGSPEGSGDGKSKAKPRMVCPTIMVPELVPEKEGYALVKFKRRKFSSGMGEQWEKNSDEERNESKIELQEIRFMEAEPMDKLSAEIAAASKANPDSEDDEEEEEGGDETP